MSALGLWPLLLAATAAPPRFSSDVEQVRLDVVVSRGGQPIADLTAGDFEVLDDGRGQRVTMVSREERTVHAVLVLDLSSSLDDRERAALREAAASLLRGLEPADRATLLTFTHDLRLVRGPEAPATVLASLAALEDRGATALYDATFAGMMLAAAAPGRPFVLVFTDGLNETSWLQPAHLLQVARGLETTVYAVAPDAWTAESPAIVRVTKEAALPEEGTGAGVEGDRGRALSSRETLERLIELTGGRLWTGRSTDDFARNFAAVLAEVKNRYLLVYEPSGSARPGWHDVRVRLKKRRGDVRVRRGYFAGRNREER